MDRTATRTGVDDRAATALAAASAEAGQAWRAVREVAATPAAPMGLAAGERPAADVDVLAGTLAAAEYSLAARMHAAAAAGSLPLPRPGAMLTARGWSVGSARRLARAGALAADHPSLRRAWAAGIITSEHVDAVARSAGPLTAQELAAVIDQLDPLWGQISPAAVARFVTAAQRLLHPPPDPLPDETDAHANRGLDFAILGDSVVLSGALPRVEGELVMNAIDALADRLRSTADPQPASCRRADALVELAGRASAADQLPTRGGLPVSLSVTLDTTAAGDPIATTGHGHLLTPAETRWACCDAAVTPIRTTAPGRCPTIPAAPVAGASEAARRITALAATMFDTRIPLDVGRTARTATAAQRRALAARDRGCVIPGCGIPAHACQTHHLTEWAASGRTDLDNLTLLCWTHHRQVDLRMWAIDPADPTAPERSPAAGAPPGTAWPANNGAPWIVTRTPRHVWRT